MSAADRTALAASVRRYSHGSRVPGWDDAADLDKDPAAIPDAASTPVPGELRATIERSMRKYPDRRSAAIPALAAAQAFHGYCSPEAIDQVACVMRLTPGYLVSVATFYDMFKTDDRGSHDVFVCTNISCSIQGADDVYDAMMEAARDEDEINVKPFECLGACDIAPMASIDGVYIGPIELDEVGVVVEQVRANDPPLPAKQILRRLSVDQGANTREFPVPDPMPRMATAGAADPVRASEQGTYGGEMPGGAPGPPAPIEQRDPPGPQGPSQSEDGAT